MHTKREKIFSVMEADVPWQALIKLIEPCYHKARKSGGRPPYPLSTMLRHPSVAAVVCVEDPALEVAFIEDPTMGRFTGIDPDNSQVLAGTHFPDWPENRWSTGQPRAREQHAGATGQDVGSNSQQCNY